MTVRIRDCSNGPKPEVNRTVIFIGPWLNVADGRKVAEAINSICRDARPITPSRPRWISISK